MTVFMVGYKTDTSMHVRHVVVIDVETDVYMGGLIWIRVCMKCIRYTRLNGCLHGVLFDGYKTFIIIMCMHLMHGGNKTFTCMHVVLLVYLFYTSKWQLLMAVYRWGVIRCISVCMLCIRFAGL
jgi:hypothetical protein